MNKNFVLLLTGTIKPFEGIPYLKIKDYETRKKQYLETIHYYVKNRVSNNIVFCENSNENLDKELTPIKLLAQKNSIKFEHITFQGSKKTIKFGKSYGESEIIDYAMSNSSLMKKNKYFIKVTGRIIITNITLLRLIIKDYKSYFLTYGDTVLNNVDTRCFCMPIDVYKRHFANIYLKRNVKTETSIEQLYAEEMKAGYINLSSIPIRLNYTGVSGGQGGVYETSKIELVIDSLDKLIRTRFGSRLYLEYGGLFQNDMIIPPNVWNNYFKIIENKRIIICGAAMYGCWFFNTARKKTKVVGWADKSFNKIKKIMHYHIESYESVVTKKFDYVVIAVYSNKAFEEIQEILVNYGVERKKIINVGSIFHECMGR